MQLQQQRLKAFSFPLEKSSLPAAVIALMFFLLPSVGAPTEYLLQDTLKSTIAAFGSLAAAILLFWQLRSRNSRVHWHGYVALPLALVVYALGSMAWSHSYLAGVEAVRWFLFALLVWTSMNATDRNIVLPIAWAIHWGVVCACLWAGLQFYLDYSPFPQAAPPASTFINRNFFAEYVICSLPWSLYALASMHITRRTWVVALSLALNITAILMTGTRAALLAMLVIAPFLGLFLHRCRHQLAWGAWSRAHRLSVAACVVVSVVAMGSIPSTSRQILSDGAGATPLQRSFFRVASVARPAEYQEGTFSIRAAIWMSTVRMLVSHGLSGVGAGAWEVQIPLFQKDDTAYETDYYAHNEFLQLLSEYGLVVGGLFLAFLLAHWLIAAKRTWELSGERHPDAPLRATVLTSLLALMIVSNAGFPWHLAGCGALFALCLGVLSRSDADLGYFQRFYASKAVIPAIASKCILVALVGMLGVAAYIAQQAQVAEQHIVRAVKLSAGYATAIAKGEDAESTKKQVLLSLHKGIGITPHYRRLTALAAENLATAGDWSDSAWVLESIAESRPNIAAVWTGLAVAYSKQGLHDQAWTALDEVRRIRPKALATLSLEISLLSRVKRFDEAKVLLTRGFDQGRYDYDMVQVGSYIGYETQDWPLVIRSLQFRNLTWPQFAADGHYRLGQIFANEVMHDDARALDEFRLGLALVPKEYAATYLQQVPARFRSSL